jgi:hypothetical protein
MCRAVIKVLIFYNSIGISLSITVAAWFRALVCCSLVAGIAGSNPACLSVVLSCVGRGLCHRLITRPDESNRVSVCVRSRHPEKGGQRSILDYKRL